MLAVSGCAPQVDADAYATAVRSGAAVVPITHGDQIAGSYRAKGTNPPDNQTWYLGEVVVLSQDDGTVRVSWAIGTDRWTGIGTITEEGELFVTYTGGFMGTGTWVLLSDGKLYGVWQPAEISDTGTEVWVRN